MGERRIEVLVRVSVPDDCVSANDELGILLEGLAYRLEHRWRSMDRVGEYEPIPGYSVLWTIRGISDEHRRKGYTGDGEVEVGGKGATDGEATEGVGAGRESQGRGCAKQAVEGGATGTHHSDSPLVLGEKLTAKVKYWWRVVDLL